MYITANNAHAIVSHEEHDQFTVMSCGCDRFYYVLYVLCQIRVYKKEIDKTEFVNIGSVNERAFKTGCNCVDSYTRMFLLENQPICFIKDAWDTTSSCMYLFFVSGSQAKIQISF